MINLCTTPKKTFCGSGATLVGRKRERERKAYLLDRPSHSSGYLRASADRSASGTRGLEKGDPKKQKSKFQGRKRRLRGEKRNKEGKRETKNKSGRI